jgi:hypothetical protein
MLAGAVYVRIGGARRDLRYVGWDGGAVGNHAQVMVGQDLLIDPTVGLVADMELRPLTRGVPVRRVVDMGHHDVHPDTGRIGRHVAGGFRDRVRDALRRGRYREGDVLYTLTAGGIRELHRRFRAAVRMGGDWRTVPIPPPEL